MPVNILHLVSQTVPKRAKPQHAPPKKQLLKASEAETKKLVATYRRKQQFSVNPRHRSLDPNDTEPQACTRTLKLTNTTGYMKQIRVLPPAHEAFGILEVKYPAGGACVWRVVEHRDQDAPTLSEEEEAELMSMELSEDERKQRRELMWLQEHGILFRGLAADLTTLPEATWAEYHGAEALDIGDFTFLQARQSVRAGTVSPMVTAFAPMHQPYPRGLPCTNRRTTWALPSAAAGCNATHKLIVTNPMQVPVPVRVTICGPDAHCFTVTDGTFELALVNFDVGAVLGQVYTRDLTVSNPYPQSLEIDFELLALDIGLVTIEPARALTLHTNLIGLAAALSAYSFNLNQATILSGDQINLRVTFRPAKPGCEQDAVLRGHARCGAAVAVLPVPLLISVAKPELVVLPSSLFLGVAHLKDHLTDVVELTNPMPVPLAIAVDCAASDGCVSACPPALTLLPFSSAPVRFTVCAKREGRTRHTVVLCYGQQQRKYVQLECVGQQPRLVFETSALQFPECFAGRPVTQHVQVYNTTALPLSYRARPGALCLDNSLDTLTGGEDDPYQVTCSPPWAVIAPFESMPLAVTMRGCKVGPFPPMALVLDVEGNEEPEPLLLQGHVLGVRLAVALVRNPGRGAPQRIRTPRQSLIDDCQEVQPACNFGLVQPGQAVQLGLQLRNLSEVPVDLYMAPVAFGSSCLVQDSMHVREGLLSHAEVDPATVMRREEAPEGVVFACDRNHLRLAAGGDAMVNVWAKASLYGDFADVLLITGGFMEPLRIPLRLQAQGSVLQAMIGGHGATPVLRFADVDVGIMLDDSTADDDALRVQTARSFKLRNSSPWDVLVRLRCLTRLPTDKKLVNVLSYTDESGIRLRVRPHDGTPEPVVFETPHSSFLMMRASEREVSVRFAPPGVADYHGTLVITCEPTTREAVLEQNRQLGPSVPAALATTRALTEARRYGIALVKSSTPAANITGTSRGASALALERGLSEDAGNIPLEWATLAATERGSPSVHIERDMINIERNALKVHLAGRGMRWHMEHNYVDGLIFDVDYMALLSAGANFAAPSQDLRLTNRSTSTALFTCEFHEPFVVGRRTGSRLLQAEQGVVSVAPSQSANLQVQWRGVALRELIQAAQMAQRSSASSIKALDSTSSQPTAAPRLSGLTLQRGVLEQWSTLALRSTMGEVQTLSVAARIALPSVQLSSTQVLVYIKNPSRAALSVLNAAASRHKAAGKTRIASRLRRARGRHWFRGVIARRRIDRFRQAAASIQAAYRGYCERMQVRAKVQGSLERRRRQYYNEKAIIIQAMWRGYYTRRHVCDFKAYQAYMEALRQQNELMREQLQNFEAEQAAKREARERQLEEREGVLVKEAGRQRELEVRVVARTLRQDDLRATQRSNLRQGKNQPHPDQELVNTLRSSMRLDRETTGSQRGWLSGTVNNRNVYRPQGPFKHPLEVQYLKQRPHNLSLRAATEFDSFEEHQAATPHSLDLQPPNTYPQLTIVCVTFIWHRPLQERREERQRLQQTLPKVKGTPRPVRLGAEYQPSILRDGPYQGFGPGDTRPTYGRDGFREEDRQTRSATGFTTMARTNTAMSWVLVGRALVVCLLAAVWGQALLVQAQGRTPAPAPDLPFQTAEQVRVLERASAISNASYAAGVANLTALLESDAFRGYLAQLDTVGELQNWTTADILAGLIAGLDVAELVHNFGRYDDGNCGMDVTMKTGPGQPYFYNQWLLQALGFIPIDVANNVFPDESEVRFFGYVPFVNTSQPDVNTSADRPVYTGLNMFRGSLGNPQCGPISAVFKRSYLQGAALAAPIDTGLFIGLCGDGQGTGWFGVHCHSWATANGTLGVLDQMVHLLPIWLEYYNSTRALVGDTYPAYNLARLVLRLLARTTYTRPDAGLALTFVENTFGYLEVNTLATLRYPTSVKMMMASFDLMFGTDEAATLRAWCVEQGWPLIWATNPYETHFICAPNTSTNCDVPPDRLILGMERANVRVLDPIVLSALPTFANATAGSDWFGVRARFNASWAAVTADRSAGEPTTDDLRFRWDELLFSTDPSGLALANSSALVEPLFVGACADPDCIGVRLVDGACVCAETSSAAPFQRV
ncbi:uncharacterized protein MONBRDRAFT_37188 [Monosiga brevicollis MX1]|uniref:Uncharacterized protein n=1 Tax=Monosiga brevicollis TaxID=81824 RepID=A9V055_MONBE|nr:uncharacterized protein MONBRDRAFT_37188 [Monosiga brevicollis MX1]EDQ89097.1 predicted protein [Monosiga brevicollis MX1]|eukprot:XP_001746202.1 hypothetical protein [Monosiga brevicollis MX1]